MSKNASPSQIKVSNLSYIYQSEPVLTDVSFDIKKGDYIGLIGPNGGGKSTLLKLILGLLPLQTGMVELFNEPIKSATKKSKIGYVPQRASQTVLNFPATVLEVIKSGITSKPTKPTKQLVEQALKLTGTHKLIHKLISNLSGGELQKVLIARALVSEPEILILDEPIVGIDTPSQEAFYAMLKTLNQKFQITILFVSHDLEIIANQVNRIFCLNKTLACQSDPKEFLQHQYLFHHHH